MSRIGAINAGSSSIKFSVFEAADGPAVLFSGQVDGIGVAPRLRVKSASGDVMVERKWDRDKLDHTAAIHEILGTARHLMNGVPVSAVGHRVVHGGTAFSGPVRVTRDLLPALEKLIPLAPLHQPHNITPIRTILDAVPDLPQVACFDTAFHRRQPAAAQAFAIPRELTAGGVYRYGFHGLSYECLTGRLQQLAPDLAKSRVVMAHLGNGASLCAMRNGQSVASTMGFTAVDGLMMGTRCGAIDPGVLLYLMQEHKMDEAAIEDLIYRKSGLLGVSGISSDMRTLRSSSEAAAREARRTIRAKRKAELTASLDERVGKLKEKLHA